jgi:sucrose-6-phosphate hydrolase SacC (GH32 family)
MDFTSPLTSTRPYDNSLGFNMGFRDTIYYGETTYTATAIVDTIGSNYLFLSLGEDYPVITQYHNNTMFIAFAKILVDAEKNAILYEDGSNTITKEYFFQQPVNMRSINIKLYDAHQEIVNLQGMDFSFTLELLEITNHSLYESVRTILHNE